MHRRYLFVLLAPLVLTGCLLAPGKFASELQLMSDGRFSFTYQGEIQMLALSELADMAEKENFEAEECHTEDGEERPCTAAEIAEQKDEWKAEAASRASKNAQEAEQMKAFLGGIDPANPEAAEELAARLERQRGWNRVDYKGDGLFEVDFATAGTLSHDFAFPTIEKLPMANMFVTVILRDGGQVGVDAPGFAAQGGGNPMQGMMAGMAGLAQLGEAGNTDGEAPPKIALPEGTFRIITDGRILANNTDEGPIGPETRQVLAWEITPRTERAPTALIAFEPAS